MSDRHLSDDELALAVVDEEDLSVAFRNHLAACKMCRVRKEALEGDLARLGRLARELVPPPQRKVVLVEGKRQRPWSRRLGLKLAGAVAAAALVLGLLLLRPGTTPDISTVPQDPMASGAASQLMLEVEALTENPLSTFHGFVIGESSSDLDDEFLDFLIPSSEQDTTTHKGGSEWSARKYTV